MTANGPRILVLQHHPLEHPGAMARALRRSDATLETVALFDGGACPATLAGYDGLLVMGGPMSVQDDDAHPWLASERALIARAMETDLPTLGVCLGSQLIAAAAGAAVTRGPEPEIGWYAIHPTDAAADDALFGDATSFAALEWHRDVFTLPAGAVPLAASARCPLQAFRLGRRVYGLLFHLEIDAATVAGWCEAFAEGAPLPAGDASADFAAANARATRIATRLFLAR